MGKWVEDNCEKVEVGITKTLRECKIENWEWICKMELLGGIKLD